MIKNVPKLGLNSAKDLTLMLYGGFTTPTNRLNKNY